MKKIIIVITIVLTIVIGTALWALPNFAVENTLRDDVISNPDTVLIEEKADIIEKNRFEGMTLRNNDSGVPVLCYHSVADDESLNGPITLSKDKLREHFQVINDLGYTTLTLKELEDNLYSNKEIPEKSVVITFDDGYKDNYTNAFPILKEFDMKATYFIITDFSVGVDNLRFINEEEIKELSQWGIDIQSHTMSHNELDTLSYEEQVLELKGAKEKLESLTNKEVNAVAYPVGKYDDNTFNALKEAGYKMGFTIERGLADKDDNPGELNRICIDYTYGPKNIKTILTKFKR